MTITQAEIDAAREVWLASPNNEPAASIMARHAQAAADQRQADIVAWLRTEQGKGSDAGADYADPFADAIESGTWRTE